MEFQGMDGKAMQDHLLKDFEGQPSEIKDSEHSVTGHGHRKDFGQASAEQAVPPTSRKVIHSVDDLHNERGDPDEYWCKVVQTSPDE